MALVYTLLFSAVGAMSPYLSLYFKSLGLSGTEVGILMAVAPVMLLVSQPVFGPLTDRSGHRGRMLARLLLAAAVAGAALALGRTFWTLLPLVMLWAFFSGALFPIADSLALGEAARTGTTYARLRLWGSVGFLVTTALLGRIYTDLRWAFVAYALFILATWAPARRLPAEGKPRGRTLWPELVRALRNPRLVAFLACSAVLQFTVTGHSAFFPIHMQRLGGTAATVGLASSLSALTEVPLWLVLGKITGRVGAPPLLTLAAAAFSLRWFLVAGALTPGGLLWLSLMQTVTFAIFMPTAVVLMGQIMPDELRTSGQALLVLVNGGVAAVAGSVISGRVVDQIGTAGLYNVLGYVAAVAAAGFLLLALPWRRDSRREVPHG